jgi:hypothetical protein
MNKISRINNTRKNLRTGCRCLGRREGSAAGGLPGPEGPRGDPEGGRGCEVREAGGYGAARCESGPAVPYGLGITRVRSGSVCWRSCPYSQSRSSSRPGDMSAKVPGGRGGTCSCLLSGPESRLVGVASAPKPQAPKYLAAIFPRFPSPADERLPRCQFAPRMLHRARRPRFQPVSNEAPASKDAEV